LWDWINPIPLRRISMNGLITLRIKDLKRLKIIDRTYKVHPKFYTTGGEDGLRTYVKLVLI
jgi:hypothetical protein